ncbi:M23 family metallopeptidase [Streptomyces sp. NPDC097619]|uniref:M23 family metallopeptidase n=1 Tax=Streptomyces sp. NPDC097619 TaxID=3157228 RepID=UPI003319B64D
MVRVLMAQYARILVLGALCLVINERGLGPLWFTGLGLAVAGVLLGWGFQRARRSPEPRRAPSRTELPVRGLWTALNGPATKTPGHTHAYAQTYAVDLVRRPAPEPVWLWPPFRRPEAYPAFGAPVLAPGAGVVVAASGGQRDHLTRTSVAGLPYFFAEGLVRAVGGPRFLLGNHLVLDLGEGVHAVLAHLRRGSLEVAVGDRVTAGQVLAACGNSGNSSEPHLHFHLMDGPRPTRARGLPFTWRYGDSEGGTHEGVPADHDTFGPPLPTSPEPAAPPRSP